MLGGVRSPFEDAASTTGSTGAGATTSGSTARSPTSAAAPSSTSAAAPAACWCRCCATAIASSASIAPPRCWPRAAARLARLPPAARRRALLVRGDLRASAVRAPASPSRWPRSTASSTCVTDEELVRFFRDARAALLPGGWLAFDVFAPTRRFLERRRPVGDDRAFATPRTGRRDPLQGDARRSTARVLATTFHYQPVAPRHRRAALPRQLVSLRHRLLQPREIEALLRARGPRSRRQSGATSTVGRSIPTTSSGEQHVYLARKKQAPDDAPRGLK